jgi:hypothetical protein
MKPYFQTLAVALALPLFAYSQTPVAGYREATRMVRARSELTRTLDARKDHSGSAVEAKLRQNLTLTNGTKLPTGTILVGEVTMDDMQQQGLSRLALRFNQARLKNGTTVPIKATIVGFFGPGANDYDGYPQEGGDQVPNSWTDGTLQVDQINVVGGVDLHSKISSANSGVFVSTKKDNVKLEKGSELQFAIGPGVVSAD